MNIQISIVFKIFISVIACFILAVSCKDNNARPEPDFDEEYLEEVADPEERTIQEALNGETDLSHFSMVLGTYEFPDYIADNQTFTVFAPVNDVFPPYSGKDEDSLITKHEELVSYYVVRNSFSLDELREIANSDTISFLNSLSGEKIYVKSEGDTVILEGNSGKKARISRSFSASNGVVHVIDEALLPTQALNP